MRFYWIFFLKKVILLIKFQAILIKMGDSEFLYVITLLNIIRNSF